MRQRVKAWAVGAIVVLAAWVGGYFFWRVDESSAFRAGFSLFEPAWMTAVGLPACLAAGFLRRSQSRLWQRLGTAVLVAGVAVLAYLASFSFFGGICLDPGDVCLTSWPSRLTALATAALYLTLGATVEQVRGEDIST